ncbi:MAG: tannase/feruloyl esterase family alpha/beta hydrolase [Betaproteobacteria bacterium]
MDGGAVKVLYTIHTGALMGAVQSWRMVILPVLIAAGVDVAVQGQAAVAVATSRFADTVVTLAQADCTVAKLGDAGRSNGRAQPVPGTTLVEPRWVPGTDALPARCEVDGRIAPVDALSMAPAINFRVWLPAAWNRRAVQQGGSGNNGVIPDLRGASYPIDGRSPAQWGFVTYGSDSGHQSSPGQRAGRGPQATSATAPEARVPTTAPGAEWALNDEAIRNLGYLQLKRTHDVTMALIERAYGERPRFNYFTGTSQGGREALTVAQRYPADYNGIISNVPIVGFSSLMLAPELIRIREKPFANWVTRQKVNAIRGEFLRQCDSIDGLLDGVINDYLGCRAIFDVNQGAPNRRPWATKRCPDNRDPDPADTSAAACLTDGQIGTLEFVYGRYRFATPLANGAKTFGMWVPNTDPSGSGLISDVRFRGQEAAQPDAPTHTHLGVLGVTGFLMRDLSANPLDYQEGGRWNRRREELSAILDSTNPDLRQFASRGAKMIVTIGTNDTLASPGAQLDYYEAVIQRMGRRAVDQFARLFVIPQANHGLAASTAEMDGAGRPVARSPLPTAFERFAYLVDWVERGVSPATTLTLTGADRTMPLCSYPSFPKYIGGSAAEASSYQCTSVR